MSIWGKLDSATAELLRAGSIGAVLGGVNGQEAGKDRVAFTVGVIAQVPRWPRPMARIEKVNALKKVFKIPAGEMKNVANIIWPSRTSIHCKPNRLVPLVRSHVSLTLIQITRSI